jgi:hypothetical protein
MSCSLVFVIINTRADSSAIVETTSRDGQLWFSSQEGQRISLILGPFLWVQREKRLGLEADYLPPSSAGGENAWSCTSSPPYVCLAWCLIKHRDIVTVYSFK